MSNPARYLGRLVFAPLSDGRLMELVQEFGFIDPSGLEWRVPQKAQIDGASIPQALWSLVGSPFTGLYREASVIHDYYCDVRERDWKAVHRVFYDGMIVSGVSIPRAKVMYAAVYFGGPRWTAQASHNNKLAKSPMIDSYLLNVLHSPFETDVMKTVEVQGMSVAMLLESERWTPPSGEETRLHLNELDQLIAQYDPSLDQIERALDVSTTVMDALIPKQRGILDVPEWVVADFSKPTADWPLF